MDKKQEQWAIFWCDLLSPVIYEEIEPEDVGSFFKQIAEKEMLFPDGRIKRPSVSTLHRKLKRYQEGGFDALSRKKRMDRGSPRSISPEVIEKAVELKKEQPRRCPNMINGFLKEMYGVTIPRSTMYRHLKQHDATRLKLGVIKKKVRKRWTRDHSNDLWLGDLEYGPYVLDKKDVVPTYLSAFIDCHSRYIVEARYYLRQNLDVLIDSLIRALTTHGAPRQIYVDNGKVYHSAALKSACYRCNIKLLHRPPGDPAPGGLIERFFLTEQNQLEAEIRAGDILSLAELNRALTAWLAVDYHKTIHSETKEAPEDRYQKGLQVVRQVNMEQVIESFMQSLFRTVNKTFSDVQVDKRFYRVDPKLRGDRVEVRFDPFSQWDTVHIYSLSGDFLGTGILHYRDTGISLPPSENTGKPQNSYADLLIRKHKKILDEQTGGIDYRKVNESRAFPFHEFAKTVADLMGRKSGLADLSTEELEMLKKVYNQSVKINRQMVKDAFANTPYATVPYVVRELKILIQKDKNNVS